MLMDVGMIFKIAGIGIVVAILHTVLKQLKQEEFAHWATLTAVAVVMYFIVSYLGQLFIQVKQVFFMQ
ncbi:stage III sporulation protein AC [Fodinisporobacter ferrooxydans]|uniref:Stage III sporulation protein AC n=1 Tax=Fodinisporobacter ferrooxydans TaxID=2901836 RepID=A0ABY4CII9_9BACL|nr:stage III sporulation protein AC [Alicyclobacillaceae bacterium MYW30-H2]